MTRKVNVLCERGISPASFESSKYLSRCHRSVVAVVDYIRTSVTSVVVTIKTLRHCIRPISRQAVLGVYDIEDLL